MILPKQLCVGFSWQSSSETKDWATRPGRVTSFYNRGIKVRENISEYGTLSFRMSAG